MIVAGVIIETLPGSEPAVAARLARIEGLQLKGGDGDRRIAAVWTGETGEALEGLAEELLASEEAIVGVFPTFVGDDEA
jgi:hypothetical protein